MTTSPYDLVQEQQIGLPHAQWRIMVCCALLNKTHGRQVRPMLTTLFERCPDPQKLLITEIGDLLRPLGLYNRRIRLLHELTQDYLAGLPVDQCRGCGQYAIDSIGIFVEGRTDVVATDTWLNKYLEWKREQPT